MSRLAPNPEIAAFLEVVRAKPEPIREQMRGWWRANITWGRITLADLNRAHAHLAKIVESGEAAARESAPGSPCVPSGEPATREGAEGVASLSSSPGGSIAVGVGGTPALRFADAAKRLGAVARAAGLKVPAFRAPPRVAGVPCHVEEYEGGAVVSVALRDRDFCDVATDMVEGVLVVNGQTEHQALREQLEEAVS